MTRPRLRTAVLIDDPDWHMLVQDAAKLVRNAANRAWQMGTAAKAKGRPLIETGAAAVEISVVLSGDDTVRELNAEHRNRDSATNVLSFPGDTEPAAAGADLLLGDIILARETVAQEAERDGKAPANHLQHLVIHGVLHLLGYDHVRDDDAVLMERLEVDCLARLGVPDPYGTAALKATADRR